MYRLKKKYVTLLIVAILLILVILFLHKNRITYIISTEDTLQPYFSCIDIFNADENDLKNLDFVHYERKFGFVENEKTAFKIALNVIPIIYNNCNVYEESPFKIKYNQNADAWIVYGTLKRGQGGVAYIGIKKETGEILFLMHTK